MPKAEKSINTKTTNSQQDVQAINTMYVLDGLYDISAALRAFSLMLGAIIETGAGLKNSAGGMENLLRCVIKDFDQKTDQIEIILNSKEGNEKENSYFEQQLAQNVEIIKGVVKENDEAQTNGVPDPFS